MTQYNLTYYNSQGLAEPIRYLFALKKIPFEDIRLTEDDEAGIFLIPEFHKSPPYHRIPLLEFDGKMLTQSTSILRFLGRKYGLCGSNDFEASKCDQYLESTRDFMGFFREAFFEKDSGKKGVICNVLLESVAPCYMSIIDDFLKFNGGKHLVGNALSIAEIYFCHIVTQINAIFSPDKPIQNEFPALKQMYDNFYEIPEIKEFNANKK